MSKALTYIEVDVDEFYGADIFVDGSSLIYDFTNNSLLGWTGSNFTPTASFNGALQNTITGADTQWRSPVVAVAGSFLSRYLYLDIERTAARTSGNWQGTVFYSNGGHGESGSFFKSIPDILGNTVGSRATIILDMGALDAGGTDWITNGVTQIRLDFDQSTDGAVKIWGVRLGQIVLNGRKAFFNGTTQYLTRGAPLSGVVDSKQFTLSMWVWRSSANAGGRLISSSNSVGGVGGICRIVMSSPDNFFTVNMYNAANVEILNMSALNVASPADRWVHYMVCVDLNDPDKCFLYQDNVLKVNVNTYTNDVIDFTRADWGIGANCDASSKFNGALADVWFAPGVYIDLSRAENRAQFYSNLSGPTDLGINGEKVIGTPPAIFLSGAANAWHQNNGRGGGFIRNGVALTDWFPLPETYRFAQPTEYLPKDIYAIPSIKSVEFNPVTVSLGEDLGQRASITVSLTDHKHQFKAEGYNVGTFWSKWRGRYLTRLRNKKIRVIRGVLGQSIAEMDTRHYLIDTVDGPTTSSATYTFIAKDALKLADDDRSQAPRLSNGSLAGSINNAVTSATLNPVGIGNIEYPASGFICFGGKEVVSFTRAGDVLTIVRAQKGTIAIAHNAGDRAQLVLDYPGTDMANILYDLLTNYVTGITTSMINLPEWQAETAAYLAVLYARTITEPTSVKKLVAEAIDQAALALFWDDQAEKIRLKVLRQIATDADTFGENVIVAQSIGVKEQATKRISQQWTYYGQRDPTNQSDDEDNFRAALATVDGVLETAYGAPAISKTLGKWIATINSAQRLNGIKLSRYRDPPRSFSFQLFRDQIIALGEGYQLSWSSNTDSFGNAVTAPIQITKLRYETDYIYVEAEEMLASGVITVTSTVFLTNTSGLLSFTVPATWNNADNSIEVIGGGGGGSGLGGSGGHGGGGGAYSKKTNQTLTPSGSVQYRVGIGGPGDTGSGATDGGDTWFNGATLAASMVGAKGGLAGVGSTGAGTGGQAASGVGTTKFNGGDGGRGAPSGESRAGGGGAGGAGGPNGNGANGYGDGNSHRDGGGGGGAADGGSPGQVGASNSQGGPGGNNRFLFGGGTTAQPVGQQGGGGRGSDTSGNSPGGDGGEGQQIWTQTIAPITAAGPGGGGGGGGSSVSGNKGGLYGGGGGGGGQGAFGGDGRQGIIVLTWKE